MGILYEAICAGSAWQCAQVAGRFNGWTGDLDPGRDGCCGLCDNRRRWPRWCRPWRDACRGCSSGIPGIDPLARWIVPPHVVRDRCDSRRTAWGSRSSGHSFEPVGLAHRPWGSSELGSPPWQAEQLNPRWECTPFLKYGRPAPGCFPPVESDNRNRSPCVQAGTSPAA